MSNLRKRLLMLFIFSVAFAYIESSVVVYLRTISYPDGFKFPLQYLTKNLVLVELGRELSTIILLVIIALLLSKEFVHWFAYFIYCFGIWDIFYYIWLYVFIKWPQSLATWDLLFLIPIPWIGPVYSPLLCSIFFVISSVLILSKITRGIIDSPIKSENDGKKQAYRIKIKFWNFILIIIAIILILYSYFDQSFNIINGGIPKNYKWYLLLIGILISTIVLVNIIRSSDRNLGISEQLKNDI